MTTSNHSRQQEWTPEQVTRGAAGLAVLAILLVALALGLYGYDPDRLPARATDFLAGQMSRGLARGIVWSAGAVLALILIAATAIRWAHRREVLATTAAIAGLLTAGIALYAYAGIGASTLAPHISREVARPLVWVLLAGAGIAAAVLAGRLVGRRRHWFATGLTEVFPREARANYDPDKDCEPSQWRHGRPRRVRLYLPDGFPTTSTAAQAALTKAMADRMGGKLDTKWHGEEVTFQLAATRTKDVARDREKDRVGQIAADLFSGDTNVLGIKQWGGPDGNTPHAFSLSYPPAARDTNEGFRRRVEITMGEKIGVRFHADWQPTRDQVTFTPRPPMPENISHPGVSIFKNRDWNLLPIGVDENGEPVCWNAKLQSHALGNGATNSGKTVTARSIIIGALLTGWEVYLNDPKQIELIGFAHDWGVKSIAATPEDMADLIARVRQLMDDRYTEIREKIDQRIDPEVDKNYRPVLVVVDEFAELVEVLGKVDEVWALLRLARACNIHLLIMTQRPDANDFKKGARDNLTWRYSMNALSEQGAKMMWENTDWGRYLPAIKGRGMAGVYGREPQEVQCFWVPDPAFPRGESDTALREELRAACQKAQAGLPASISGAGYDLPPVKPAPEGDLDQIVTDPGELLTVILDGDQIEAASTLAETVVADDRIIVNDQAWDVTNVGEVGADQVTIGLQAVSGGQTKTITRAITAAVLSVVTTGNPATVDEDEDEREDEQADGGAGPASTPHRTTTGPALLADDEVAATTGADEMPPPPPLFANGEDDEDLFLVPDDPEPPPKTPRPPATPPKSPEPASELPTQSPAGNEPGELVDTLRRAWRSIPDPAARDALLASAPDTPEVRALKAELTSAGTGTEADNQQTPGQQQAAETTSEQLPATDQQPADQPAAESEATGRRADQLTPGDRIMWRNKKSQLVAYTVQHVEPAGEAVRVTLKPARGRDKIVEIPTAEQIELAGEAA